MDSRTFDRLVADAARRTTRRSALRLLAGGLVGGLVALRGVNARAQRVDGDGDGLFDDDETGVYGTNPGVADTDGDGSGDGEEVFYGTDPLTANGGGGGGQTDSDGDGLFDADETGVYGTNPGVADSDGDGVGDGQEVYNGTNPAVNNGDGGGEPLPAPAPEPAPAPAPGPLVCVDPLVNCSGECVDVQTDARHCGGCGATCFAGICVGAICLPFTLPPI